MVDLFLLRRWQEFLRLTHPNFPILKHVNVPLQLDPKKYILGSTVLTELGFILQSFICHHAETQSLRFLMGRKQILRL